MNNNFRTVCFLFILAVAFTGNGCAKNDELQKKYGNDSAYYQALVCLKNNDEETAIRLLRDASRKASPLVSRRSLEKLSTIGSVQDRIESCNKLHSTFNDSKSLVVLCRELFHDREYARIILVTEKINLSTEDNETVFYRLVSLLKKNDSKFLEEFFKWTITRDYSSYHQKLFGICVPPENSVKWKLIEFRTNVYLKNYNVALKSAKEFIENKEYQNTYILSDFGKCSLYSSSQAAGKASYLDELEKKMYSDKCKFYTSFYAGRLYDKHSSTQDLACARFLSALKYADDDKKFDNVLWYYFNCLLKSSIPQTLEAIRIYSDYWHSKEYFNDFFDTLSERLLSAKMYDDYYNLANLLRHKASEDTVAKYSYVSARLIQKKLVNDVSRSRAKQERERLLDIALNCGTDLYYKIMAASRLKVDEKTLEEKLYAITPLQERTVNVESEKFLEGYADYGLPEFIYDEYVEFKNEVGMDCVSKISGFLFNCAKNGGEDEKKYIVQSIRIASRRLFAPEGNVSRQLYELSFPQNYSTVVSQICNETNQDEYLLYALVRSESFFDEKIVSHAGAVGLSQLMESTAADIARKLRIPDYDLTDARTNLMFGSFYLEELKTRMDESAIMAIISYNGGIGRVRSWKKSVGSDFTTKKFESDLFLETLPFSETREYGRKVVSAAAIYSWLYYNKVPSLTAEELMAVPEN